MGEKSSKNYLSKLDVIWGRLPSLKSAGGMNSRMLQLLILRHILGDYTNGLNISMTLENEYGTEDEDRLLSNLTAAVSLLITQAYRNLDSGTNDVDSKVSDELKQLRGELERVEKDNVVLRSRFDELCGVIKEQNKRLSANDVEINKLNAEKDELQTRLSELQTLNGTFISDRFDTENKLAALENENSKLVDTKNEIEIENKKAKQLLQQYSNIQKLLLPYLQETMYCRTYKGKSIGLVPSQIENVIRNHLKGDSNYRISKDLGISKTTVNKILSVDYRTSDSLKKILSALHNVNVEGNWGGERKNELLGLISSYEVALSAATQRELVNREQIEQNIKNLGAFLKYTNVLENKKGC